MCGKKFQAVLGERFPGLVENGDGFAAGFFIERFVVVVRNPRAADVFESENLRVMRHAFDIVAQTVIRKMSADGIEAARVELRLELLRREAVSAGEFHVLDAPSFHFVQRARHVFGELIAQAVKLQAVNHDSEIG